MAHLTCDKHKKRVMVIRSSVMELGKDLGIAVTVTRAAVIHRGDGRPCSGKRLMIGDSQHYTPQDVLHFPGFQKTSTEKLLEEIFTKVE